MLNDPAVDRITASSAPFWVMAAALKQFKAAEGHGYLPVNANIPDMTSDSRNYVTLKQMLDSFSHLSFPAFLLLCILISYKARSDADAAAVLRYVRAIQARIGQAPATISDAQVLDFVRNVRSIALYRTTSIDQECRGSPNSENYCVSHCDISFLIPPLLPLHRRPSC